MGHSCRRQRASFLMALRTRPRGDQLSFLTSCHRCAGELSISNGRPERHDCEPQRQLPYLDELEHIKWPPPMAG